MLNINILAFAGLALAMMQMYLVPGRPAGDSCATQSVVESWTIDTGNSFDVQGNNTLGQEFQAGSNATIHSVRLTVDFTGNAGNTSELRWKTGSSTDHTTYTANVTGVSVGSTGTVDYVFSEPRPTITSGTIYGFSVDNSGSGWGNRVEFGYCIYDCTTSDSLPSDEKVLDGQSGGKWTHTINSDKSVWYEVYKCD